MSLDPPGAQFAPPLTGRLAPDADAEQVADAIGQVWVEVELALSPIIGQRGVAALMHRSLRLVGGRHPWLGQGQPAKSPEVDRTALRAAILLQTAPEAIRGGLALLQAFRDLLASLIGAALTEQLLRIVWTQPTGAPPAQDISS
jgi:hypothetical protein